MSTNNMPVYTHVKKVPVKSGHGPNTNYLVCYGYVDWQRDGNLKTAIYVLMEYGGNISYSTPPHILTEKDDTGQSDFIRVMKAVDELRLQYQLD